MSSRTSITKKACDGCKVRKIRCGGGHPCKSCANARIKCTYIRVQQPRGPQKLRPMTKYLIEQAQRGVEDEAALPSAGNEGHSPPSFESQNTGSQTTRIPPNVLASPLYTYHVRMYPVWPIVDVESVMSTLQQDVAETDHETYALATAVAAATMAQLRLGQNSLPDKSTTAETFAEECMRARRACDYRTKVNLHNVRTAFFLHVYHENQQSGGSESLLYLREAISLAQMMYLHREALYTDLPPAEQQIRRRVLWLLFVTERGVCILHKLPVVLKTNISTPELDANDEPQVLPAFLKLLNLFRLFEQSRMFDLIEDDHPRVRSIPDEISGLDRRIFDMLHSKLRDGSTLLDHISDVQKADLCVTRHWMRMILWRVSSKKRKESSPSPHWFASPVFPVLVAKDLLSIVSQLPRTAIEAHGLGMELKLYEIANSLADAVMDLAILPQGPAWDGESRPGNILARLHSILSTFRGGGNKHLADILSKKMSDAQCMTSFALLPALTNSHERKRLETTQMAQNESVTTLGTRVSDSTHREEMVSWLSTALPSQEHTGVEANTMADLLPSSFSPSRATTTIQLHSQGDSNYYSLGVYDPGQPPLDLDFLPPGYSSPLSLSFLSSSLPSSSVEMLVGNFISDIPAEQFSLPPDYHFPMSNEISDPPFSNEEFLT